MKKYTQADFDNFEVDDYGHKICPAGDYTAITNFGEGYRFGEGCRFGEWSRFGEWCRFGKQCIFGAVCSFGKQCIFGEGCHFGTLCRFDTGCRFGSRNEQCPTAYAGGRDSAPLPPCPRPQ